MQFFEWFKKTGVWGAIGLFGVIILLSGGLTFYFKSLVDTYQMHIEDAAFLRSKTDHLESTASLVDRTARQSKISGGGTALSDYENALEAFRLGTDSIKYHVRRLNISPEWVIKFEESTDNVLELHQAYVTAMENYDSAGMANTYRRLPDVEPVVSELSGELFPRLQKKAHQTGVTFTNVEFYISFLQILLVFCIPLLFYGMVMLKRYKGRLFSITREMDGHNRTYVFDSMEEIDYEDVEAVKNSLLKNLQKATDFIQNITNGNYDVKWDGTDRQINKENIAGELIRMREQMKSVREQDEARRWAAEGLSQFGEIIRKYQDNFDELADGIITNLVKYVKARVGGLFILEEEDGVDYLQLRACYAYDRKKYLIKRFDTGQGLVGQAYQEGMTVYLTEVPEEYMQITSGLGDTNPRSLLIIPLKTNEKIEGVLELASLNEFKPYEIEFLEKLAESLASSIVSVRTAEETQGLLRRSQEQSEEMRAQEEEMRQNMEELEATQEQMGRQVAELNKLKDSLEEEKYLFAALMDNLPESIYFKDMESKFIRVSKYMGDHFGVKPEEIIGKSDFDFQDEAHAQEAKADEQQIARSRQPKINFLEKEIGEGGDTRWVMSSKLPLLNQRGEIIGTFGVSHDVTQVKMADEKVLNEATALKESIRQYESRITFLEQNIKEKEKEIEALRKK